MLLYRLGQQPHIASTAELGGLYSDGRWHEVGTPILYTSEHLSLAKLEVLANAATLPRNYFLLTLEIADHASTPYLEIADLPLGWNGLPYRRETAQLAQSWIQAGTHWLLRVPSIHSPNEYNYLLNPLHPDHAQLRIVSTEPHPFDARLEQ